MKRVVPLLIALLLGIAAAEFLLTNFAFRRGLGRVVRRGELQALVGRRGIYDDDVERAFRAQLFADGGAGQQPQEKELLARLVDLVKLEEAAGGQSVSAQAIDHQMDLLRWQFPDEKSWRATLPGETEMRREVAANLRGQAWLEAHLAGTISPNDEERRQFYNSHADTFQAPQRFRASHLFLAAPDGYPPEVIEAKRALIQTISSRLQSGESFSALVAEFSEDEATKKQEGDLNWFGTTRMLPEIFSAAQSLPVGKISEPIRSRLGFHLLRVTQVLPAEHLNFAQADAEITVALENSKRAFAVAAVVTQLGGKIQFATQGN